MGHKFFCTSHCLMQSEWNSCPQSSIPIVSPSSYSSCGRVKETKKGKKETFRRKVTLTNRIIHKPKHKIWSWSKLLEELSVLTWQMQQISPSTGGPIVKLLYFFGLSFALMASSFKPVLTFPIWSSSASSSWVQNCYLAVLTIMIGNMMLSNIFLLSFQ